VRARARRVRIGVAHQVKKPVRVRAACGCARLALPRTDSHKVTQENPGQRGASGSKGRIFWRFQHLRTCLQGVGPVAVVDKPLLNNGLAQFLCLLPITSEAVGLKIADTSSIAPDPASKQGAPWPTIFHRDDSAAPRAAGLFSDHGAGRTRSDPGYRRGAAGHL
jgi:hypothetical protein